MQIGTQEYPYNDVVDTRKQTPTKTKAILVQIGPGDPISNVPVVIDFPHHQIHEGEAYNYEYYSTAPATISFAITVPTFSPTIRAPHLIIEAEAYEGAGMVSLFEGITYTGGDAGLVYNRNRNVPAANTTTIKSGIAITGAGTRLPYTMFFGAGKETRASVGSRDQSEIVMKSNTVYGIELEEIVAITRVLMRLSWYEDLGV